MSAQIVYDNVPADSGVTGTLFAGRKFFITQRVPMRNHFCEQVKSNGGEVVALEKQADYLIVDDIRKDTPPGGISYRFIEASIKKGMLANPKDHAVGPRAGSVRDVGSMQPTRSNKRVPFTAEDDRILYKWVAGYAAQGGAVKGNEIYKQLEQKYPHHPWQSWRDRYVKYVQIRPPAGVNTNAPPSPPSDDPPKPLTSPAPKKNIKATQPTEKNIKPELTPVKSAPSTPTQPGRLPMPMLTDIYFKEFYCIANEIQSLKPSDYQSGFKEWARQNGGTAEEWIDFYRSKVLPVWSKDRKAGKMEENHAKYHAELVADDAESTGSQKDAGSGLSSQVFDSSPGRKIGSEAARKEDEEHVAEPRISPKAPKRKVDPEQSPESHLEELETGRKRQRVVDFDESETLVSTSQVNGDAAESNYEETPVEESKHSTQIVTIEVSDGEMTSEEETDDEFEYETLSKEEPEKQAEKEDLADADPERPRATTESAGFDLNLDFDVVPPEGGWDRSSIVEEEDEDDGAAEERARRRQYYDTQKLLEEETQGISMPEPEYLSEDSDEDATLAANNFSRAESEDDDKDEQPLDEAGIQEFYQRMLKRGFSAATIKTALYCTSLKNTLAEEVIQHIHEHNSIPQNIRGVWTKEDDEACYGADARKFKRLEEKHGSYDMRIEFLNMWNS